MLTGINNAKTAGAALIPLVLNLREMINLENLTLFVIDNTYGDFGPAKE